MAHMSKLLEKLLKESEEATQFPDGLPYKPNVLTQYPDALQIAEDISRSDDEPASSLDQGYRKKP